MYLGQGQIQAVQYPHWAERVTARDQSERLRGGKEAKEGRKEEKEKKKEEEEEVLYVWPVATWVADGTAQTNQTDTNTHTPKSGRNG